MISDLNADVELSKYIADTFGDLIFIKECYANVCRLCLNMKFNNKFKESKVEVVFGANQLDLNRDDIYFKHAFLLIDDVIVDPTLAKDNSIRGKYMIFKKFSVQEFLNLVSEYGLDASLGSYGMNLFHEESMRLFKENIYLIG